MSHGHWIKKMSLFFCCTTTMLSLRLVISTAGFCVVRFHLDNSYIDVFISRLVNAALISHQLGNWIGVIAIAVAAATDQPALKLYGLTAANWLCLAGMSAVLVCFCAGEDGSLTGFYWSMSAANLFHKTSHAICFEIAPCGANCTRNGFPESDCKADATNYCAATLAVSALAIALIKSTVLALVGDTDVWKQVSAYSQTPGRVTVTLVGARSVKTSADYRAAKAMMAVTIAFTSLMCVAWSVIVWASVELGNSKDFEVDWKNKGWKTRVVCGILGILPGIVMAAIAALLFGVVIGGAYRAGCTAWLRGLKWVLVFAGVVVAVRVALVYSSRKKPNLDYVDCILTRKRRSPTQVTRMDVERYDELNAMISRRMSDMEGQNAFSLTLQTLLEPKLESVHHEITEVINPNVNELEEELNVIDQKINDLGMLKEVPPRRNRRLRRSTSCSSNLDDISSGTFNEKLKCWWEKQRPKVVEELRHSMDNAAKDVQEAVSQVRETLQKVNNAVHQVESTAQEVRSTVRQVQDVQRLVDQAKEETSKAAASTKAAAEFAQKAALMGTEAVSYAQYASLRADKSAADAKNAENKASDAANSAKEANQFADAATLLAVEAVVSAAHSARSASTATKSATLSALASAAAMGTSQIAMWTSASAVGTASAAAFVSGAAMQGSNLAMHVSNLGLTTAKEAWEKVNCGVDWMKKKIKEIFGFQEANEGMMWKVILTWGIVGVLVVGLSDVERDWGGREGREEDLSRICKRAAVVGGGMGLIGGVALGAFADELGASLNKEYYGKVSNVAEKVNEFASAIGLSAGTGAGFLIGIIIGACVSNRDSEDNHLGHAMGGGALVGAEVGIVMGLSYQAAVGEKWARPGATTNSLFIDIFGLGTVYSIYPGMAPCSITHFKYFNIIDLMILSTSFLPPITTILVSEWTVYGPEQEWNTDAMPWMWVWYIGVLLVIGQHFCMMIIISVLQNTESKLARQVTSSPWRASILTVMMVTSGEGAAVIGYAGVVANSNYSSATIMLNNTATLATTEFTAVLGEGYLTELKKYEPGMWPTQGMGRLQSYLWWCGRTFKNAWQIFTCICTKDMRRDIMLCKQ